MNENGENGENVENVENVEIADERNHVNNSQHRPTSSFWERIESKDVVTISSDLFPSLILIGFIINALIGTDGKLCTDNFTTILKAMIFIYTAFAIKSLFHVTIICLNSQNSDFSKVSLKSMDFLLNLCYYIAVIAAYFVYRSRPEECFMANTFATILMFSLVLIGVVNISRHILNIFMIVLCFPVMVYYFLRNPQSFYSNFGIDPEIVRNLPTIKADPSHVTCCSICVQDIKEGDEILVLRCAGKHCFHEDCIKTWLLHKVNCPVCRQENVI